MGPEKWDKAVPSQTILHSSWSKKNFLQFPEKFK